MGNKLILVAPMFLVFSLFSCGKNINVSNVKSAAFVANNDSGISGGTDNGNITVSSSSESSSSESSSSESSSSESSSSESSTSESSSEASSVSSVPEGNQGSAPAASEERKLEIHYCTCKDGECNISGSVMNGYSFGLRAFNSENEVYSSAIGGGSVGLIDLPFNLSTDVSSVTLSFYGINSQLPPTYLNGLECLEDNSTATFTAACTQEGTLISGTCQPDEGHVYIYAYTGGTFSTYVPCENSSYSVQIPEGTTNAQYVVKHSTDSSIAQRIFISCQ